MVKDWQSTLSESNDFFGDSKKANIQRSQRIISPDKAFPVLENLDEIPSQTSDQKCFIVLDNFANVNILPHLQPLAIRRLQIHRSCDLRLKRSIVWAPVGTTLSCSFNRSKKASKFIRSHWQM